VQPTHSGVHGAGKIYAGGLGALHRRSELRILGSVDELEAHRVELSGEYDIGRRAELREALAMIAGSATIDLSKVTYGDSTFLQELSNVKRRLGEGVTITLAGPSGNIRRLLSIVAFDALFRITE
jgi:anti-anti-sigma regulatory factor